MDAEEWFHVPGHKAYAEPSRWETLPATFPRALDRTLALLDKGSWRATFFMLGWIARRYPAEIRRIAQAGHEIACHGEDHLLVNRMSPCHFHADLSSARSAIEDAAGAAVRGFRAPMWSMPRERWPYDTLSSLGFTYSSSHLPIPGLGLGRTAPSRIGEVWEIPVLASGWGPFAWPAGGTVALRLLPISWLRRARDTAVARGRPAVYWFHPWELLEDAPRAEGGAFFRWARFARLDRLPARLAELIPAGDRTLAAVLRHLDGVPQTGHTVG